MPAAPHSSYNRGLVLSLHDNLALDMLPACGRLAVEVDGAVSAHVTGGDRIELRPRAAAARVVRLGRTTFYQRARRKLRVTDSAEIAASLPERSRSDGRVMARAGSRASRMNTRNKAIGRDTCLRPSLRP